MPECDGRHPLVMPDGCVIYLYDLVAHCQSWAQPRNDGGDPMGSEPLPPPQDPDPLTMDWQPSERRGQAGIDAVQFGRELLSKREAQRYLDSLPPLIGRYEVNER